MYIEVDYAEKITIAAIMSIPGVGGVTLRRLLAEFGSARNALEAPDASFPESADRWYAAFMEKRDQVNPARLEEVLTRLGVLMTAPGERTYPYLLGALPDAPPVLFYRGTLDGCREAVAIVGARRATAYGKSAAYYFGKEIAQKGYVVISGLARGIDKAVHEGALYSGITWAYLGGDLDLKKIYPSEHRGLAERILERGALISEYPPGTPTLPQAFPARNRLISGSSLGVVVVEAAEKSGSLITAEFALEQGREVFAVPGPIFSPLSKGCHNLLRMGAHIAETADDVLDELPVNELNASHMPDTPGLSDLSDMSDKPDRSDDLSEHMDLLNFLSDIPLHIDRLAVQSDLPPQKLAMGLLHLELEGCIQRLPGQHYVLDRRHNINSKLR
jgi:DNA processing protein